MLRSLFTGCDQAHSCKTGGAWTSQLSLRDFSYLGNPGLKLPKPPWPAPAERCQDRRSRKRAVLKHLRKAYGFSSNSLVAKTWRRFTLWKYPVVIIYGVWGAFPALQPGVTGYKSSSDFFGGRQIERIELKKIKFPQEMKPEWCMYDENDGMDGAIVATGCGVILDGKKALYSLEPIGNRWNDNDTIYKYGTLILNINLGAEDVDLARDWAWLKFFYGYDPSSYIGRIFTWLHPFLASASFAAALLLTVFIASDLTIGLIAVLFFGFKLLVERMSKKL